MLMLPARDAALLGWRTLALDRAALARCRPATVQRHSMLDVGVVRLGCFSDDPREDSQVLTGNFAPAAIHRRPRVFSGGP